MIVRIATEAQYELQGGDDDELRRLDNEAVAACAAGEERQFHDAFGRLLEFVRSHGEPVPDDQLSASDLILPPPDTSMEEARAEFTGEGLIPG